LNSNGDEEVRELRREVRRMTDAFSEAITIVGYNLDFDSYLIFKTHSPVVHQGMGGRIDIQWMHEPPQDADIVGRCLNFVINTAIRLEALA
jgi:hypothetical protein